MSWPLWNKTSQKQCCFLTFLSMTYKGFHGSRPSLLKMEQLEGPRTERTRRWPQGGGEQLGNTENRAQIFQQSQSPPMKLGFLGSRSTVPRPSPTQQCPLVKLGPCSPDHWHDLTSSRKDCLTGVCGKMHKHREPYASRRGSRAGLTQAAQCMCIDTRHIKTM